MKYIRMRVVFFEQRADKLGSVEAEVHRPQIPAKIEMSLSKAPLARRAQVAIGMMREDGLADVEQVDAAIELARARLGAAVGALGDQAHDAVLLAKEREDLRGLAVLGLAQTDAAVGDERHTRNYSARTP